jgi:hypothetical protein
MEIAETDGPETKVKVTRFGQSLNPESTEAKHPRSVLDDL